MSRRFASDERGVAAVIGFALMLAAAMSYYSFVVKTDVPRWGAENEREWDGQIGAAMAQLARDSENGLGAPGSVATVLPGPPVARSFDVPLLGRTQPLDPTGTLTFVPDCGGATVTQGVYLQAPRVAAAGGGCLAFEARPIYSDAPFGYTLENGALLRVQGAESLIVRGPLLTATPILDSAGDIVRLDVVLRMQELRGDAFSLAVGEADAHVSLSSDRTAAERGLPTNNTNALDIVFDTKHVEAWRHWLATQVDKAALNAPTHCPGGGCATVMTDAAAGTVTLVLAGPRAGATANDISFQLVEGSYQVASR